MNQWRSQRCIEMINRKGCTVPSKNRAFSILRGAHKPDMDKDMDKDIGQGMGKGGVIRTKTRDDKDKGKGRMD
jgi:hypothetical protein